MIEWNDEWDNRDNLDNMTINEIYRIWNEVDDPAKKEFLSKYIADKFNWDGGKLFEYCEPHTFKSVVKMAHDIFDKDAINGLIKAYKAQIEDDFKEKRITVFQKVLRLNAINEAGKLVNGDDYEVTTWKYANGKKEEVQSSFINTYIKGITSEDFTNSENLAEFDLACEYGTLDEVDPAALEHLRNQIRQLTRFAKSDYNTVLNNNNKLAEKLDIIGLSKEEILHEGLFEDVDKIKINYVDGNQNISDGNRQKVDEMLRANAFLRATYDALSDPKFEEVENVRKYFQDRITANFKRSLVLASITGQQNSADKIIFDPLTKQFNYDANDEEILSIINSVDSSSEENPINIQYWAAMCDSHDMEMEDAANSQALKSDSFQGKVENAKNKITEFNFLNAAQKTWKKTVTIGKKLFSRRSLTNFIVYGGTAAAMFSPAAGVAVAGSLIYAGWSIVNAKFMPIYDRAKLKIASGLQRKQAWSEAKAEFKNNERAQQRAKWRTREAEIIGALGVGAAFFGAQPFVKYGRQIVTGTGAALSLHKTKMDLKQARENYFKDRGIKAVQEIHELENQKKQDIVRLSAVVTAAVAVDTGLTGAIMDKVKETAVVQNIQTSLAGLFKHGGNSAPAAASAAEPVAEPTLAAETVAETGSYYDTDQFVADTTGVRPADSAVETAAFEDGKGPVAPNVTEISDLNDIVTKWGSDFVQDLYNKIMNGEITSMPKGMKPELFIDKFHRLAQLAPGSQSKALNIILRDINCPDEPSDADKAIVQQALDYIVYEEGTMKVVLVDDNHNIILDKNGNPCIGKTKMWGQYVGPQPMATLNDGTELPMRTPNRAIKLLAEVDCDKAKVKIINTHVGVPVDCGCEEHDVPPSNEQEIKATPRVEIPVEEPVTLKDVNITENPKTILVSNDYTGEVKYGGIKAGLGATYNSDNGTNTYADFSKLKQLEGKDGSWEKNGEPWVRFKSTDQVKDPVTGYTGREGDTDPRYGTMSKKDWDAGKAQTPLRGETPKAPVTSEQYAQLKDQNTEITHKGSSDGHDRFDTSLDSAKHVTIPAALSFNPDAAADNMTIEQNGDKYVVTTVDENGQEVKINFDTKGHGFITNAKGEETLMKPVYRDAMADAVHDFVLERFNINVKFNFGAPDGTLIARLDDIRNNDVNVNSAEYTAQVAKVTQKFSSGLNRAAMQMLIDKQHV